MKVAAASRPATSRSDPGDKWTSGQLLIFSPKKEQLIFSLIFSKIEN
jgi:hypothetical protein